jgi:DNA polymerase elongation subunit (family B)
VINIRTLALDIETSPSICYTWSLFDTRIGVEQIVEPPRMICFAARWVDEPECMFFSEFHHGRSEMIRKAHEMLSECDALLTYNGKSFDAKHLHREFLLTGLTPPAPYQNIDLYLVARKQFKFISNKLQNISKELGLEGKVQHSGFDLWKRCLGGDQDAWEEMKNYNMRDVDLLLDLYQKLLPWINSHPNKVLIDGVGKCTRCGSNSIVERESSYTAVSRFPRFQCLRCGGWMRGTKRSEGYSLREVA